MFEERLNLNAAVPTNVTAIYDATAHSLSVSFQQAPGSTDVPVYGAVFLDPAEASSTGGITLTGTPTNGSKVVTFSSGTDTLSLLPGQTVTGTGIPSGTTITSVDSLSQITLSKAATASGGTSLTFSEVLTGTLHAATTNGTWTSGSTLVTGLSSTANLLAGSTVTSSSSGIPAGTKIAAINSPTSITLSQAATASQGGKTLTFTSPVVTGLPSTAGLFVGQSITGTGIPIPTLPTNLTQGTPEVVARIKSIDSATQITLTTDATTGGAQSLTFITGLALDGSGMQFVANVIDTKTVFTQTYTYSPTYQNPYLLNAYQNTLLKEPCFILYHNQGGTSGAHSVIGDGAGFNSDNSYTNNNNSDDYQVYNGLIDYNISGNADGNDNTPTVVMNGATTSGSATVTGLTTVLHGVTTSGSATVTINGPPTTGLVVGEPVSGIGIPVGTTISAINSTTTLTLSQNATATSQNSGVNLTFNYAATLPVGEHVTGNGLPAGDTVASIGSTPGTFALATAATQTNPGTNLTFDTVLFQGYRLIGGAVDLNFDGTINNSDTTSTLAGHPRFLGFNVIGGKIDMDGNGTINNNDSGDLGIEYSCPTPVIINPVSDVSVTSTDGVVSVVPGTSTTYTIVVSNVGPGTAPSVAVSDMLPAGVASFSWSGNGRTNVAGALSDTIASLTPGATVTYTVVAAISPSATGSLVNTVTATAANDFNTANNSATDTDTLTPQADLSITNTVASATYFPSSTVTYTVTVNNSGPSNAVGAIVADSITATLTGVTWTSTTTGSASVGSGGTGSGNSLAATVNIPAGAGNSVVFTITGMAPCWCTATGNLVTAATVAAPPGLVDPNTSNNTSANTDSLTVGLMPITVNSAGDDPSGPSPGTVTLRDAINAVNLNTADSIFFAIPGTPVITLAADLPAIDRLVYIDGSSQPGVTVNGNGFVMLDVSSTVNLKDLLFTDGTVTVESNGALDVESNFDVGLSSVVNNHGSVDVCGSFLGGDSTGVTNYNASDFDVEEAFAAGPNSYVYDYGTAALSVASDFSLGDDGYVYNGLYPTDTASFTVGGHFSVGAYGFVYDVGSSALSVTGNLTLGDNSYVYSGLYSTDTASFTVGGSVGLGVNGYVYAIGNSALRVAGNLTLGDGGYVYSGLNPTDNATFTVGGSVGLGASSFVYDYGSSALSVTGNLTLGNNGFFVDYGSISVRGSFNPGTGDPGNQDVVSGTFIAAPGSSVATGTAAWEVAAGGLLDVAPGATLSVAPGGSLVVDGSVRVEGAFVSSATSAVVVEGNGALTAVGAGQINIQGTLLNWANPAGISGGTALGNVQLNATANVPGTFTYTLADGTTLANGAVLYAGPDQILIVTFTPANTAFPSARARVSINVD
jgi:uncharacterized repeat protein (TIGR01451 family)